MSDRPAPRMLLIAPRFFGYENEIAGELTRQGMALDILPDRPSDLPASKAVLRIRPELVHRAADRFFADRIAGFGRSDYQFILVIQGESVTAATLAMLRRSFPAARLVFTTWDSLENKPFSKANLGHYDRCSTFDPVDAKNHGMVFRPLFFSPGFDRPARSTFEYDVSFIGTVHSDRYRIVKALTRQLDADTKAFVYLFLQAPWMFDLRKMFTRTVEGAKRAEFRFEPMRKQDVQSIFFASRAVLDIEHPKQRGVTMRTIEAIGSRTKMITTNALVRDYDFFDAANFFVIDRKRPRLERDFLHSAYRPIPEAVRQRYSLRQWVRDVCDLPAPLAADEHRAVPT